MKKIFLFAFVLFSVAINAQSVTKKIALTKGQQYEQVSQMNMHMTQEMMGQAIDIKMEATTNSLVEVKDVSANSYQLASTVKRIVMNMSGMQDMKFDSDKKEDLDGQMGESVKDKINKTKEFTVNHEGVITEIKNKEKEEDAAGGMGAGMMSNMFGQDGEEKEGMQFQALANLPSKGVKVGDSWSDSTTDKNTKAFTTYTLKEVKGNDGLVTLNSNMNVNRDIEQQGMTIQIALQGTTLGEFTFDVATGIIKAKKATTKATGTVEAMGQSIPMTIDTTVTSTISKK
ncbi:MAG TPA: DUF6263 family protein [Flavitalea sp.]|nr:DUF6263 family protein [Flavitalea sp.]